MNKFNVIDQVSSLESLEEDYNAWSSLPYSDRRLSDDECLRVNGMTNLEFYEQAKSKFTGYNPYNTSVNENYTIDEDYLDKVNSADQMAASPNITILIPYKYTSEEELVKAYEEYQYLPFKSRLMSDEYSRQIWGYTVPDIFTFEKERLTTDPAEREFPVDEMGLIDEIAYESIEAKRIKNLIESKVMAGDKIGLLQTRLQQYYQNVPKTIKEAYEAEDSLVLDTVNDKFDKQFWRENMAHYVPYFTVDEMMSDPYCEAGMMNHDDWKDKLLEAVHGIDEDRMRELGWNPAVAFTEKNIGYAKERQLNWLEHNIAHIVNIEGISNKFGTVTEAINGPEIKALYKENDLYPVLIVLSYTGSVAGKVINAVKKSQWSHAGISTEVGLKSISSYNFRGKEYNGFTEDNLSRYLKENGDTQIQVLCIFVDHKTFIKVKSTIKDIKSNVKNTKYDFPNLINMAFNRAKKFEYPENLALVCSQFVDLVLRVSNIELVNKANNLVLPQDFSNISGKNPKVYKVYEGLARRYRPESIERDISVMLQKHSVENIRSDADKPIEHDKVEDKEGVIETLNIMTYLLRVEPVVTERFFPIKVRDNGDISIEFKKDLEQQYQESHKLLTTYGKDNLDGIKHELAHLFYLNSIIEGKINKMKKADDDYTTLANLRARILNDFKKYIKVVNKAEPGFQFGKYFQDSEYYNGAITLDNGLMKLSGKIISKFFSRGL